MKRRLSTQTLEQRQLLAGDLEVAHNYWNSFDVNQDLQISPSDALSVINYLATNNAQGEEAGLNPDDFEGKKVDVNADGNITPSDALGVINALARGEQMTPLVELFLDARDADDNLLPETNGIITVGTGIENSFFLEVSYNDLRTFGDDIGVFSIFPDINTDKGNLIQPVLRETQQLIIGEEIRQSSSGSVTIGREGTTDTFDITLGELGAGNFKSAMTDGLVNVFGLAATDFEITEPAALAGENGNDLGLQIRYIADSFGNVDLPDLTISESFDNAVPVEFREFAPFEADGTTPNSSAVRFNLDSRSRTLNDNEEFYANLQRGNFDVTDGFTDIGGVGGVDNVRQVDDNGTITEPFDAFRIEVFVRSGGAISDADPLVIDVNPGEGVDPLTLYGSDDIVTEDLITLGVGSRVTISTGSVGVNNPPVLGTTPLTETYTEDDASDSIDLLFDATDADAGDVLSVNDFVVVAGDSAGLTLNGNSLTVDPTAYNALAAGASEIITVTFDVSDGQDDVEQSLTITINGVNDDPLNSGDITQTVSENAPSFNVDLLENASDPDGDTLDATGIAVRAGSGDSTGITIDDTNNQLVVDPSAYASLEDGESETVTYDYTISDGNGGTVAGVAIITIEGDTPNRDPIVTTSPLTLSLSEDDADASFDLLAGASDPDGDTLTVTNLSPTSATGVTQNGNSLSISPSAYNDLAVGDSVEIGFTYTIDDGESGTVDQSATITITGANDAPVITAEVSSTVSEDDSSTNVDLLAGSSDPDTGDSVNVDALTRRSGDDSGISANGPNGLTIDPSAYNSLAVGESVTVIYDYNLIDGNGGETAQVATITITGANDAPTVGNAITETVTEDDSAPTVDLLAGAADVDTNDTLTIDNLSTVSGDSTPFTIVNDTSLTFDPNFYNALAAGESEIVQITYDVVDGNGGETAQTATITITGVNDAPVVTDVIDETFTEDDSASVVSLLDNASDPDTNDTLTIADVNVTGDQTGVTRNGTDVSVDPSAYGDLEDGQTIEVVFTYNVTDGTENVAQTATITITGSSDNPVVGDDISVTRNESDDSLTVNLLEGASDPNDDPIFITEQTIVSGDSSGVTVDVANSQLLVDPSAYADLEDGEQVVVVVQYKISDDQGNVSNDTMTATVTINGETINGSTITGQLFIDHIENIDEVRAGATPIRNGFMEDDEQALAGVTVRLLQVTPTGEVEIASVLTGAEGEYFFTGVEPGTYFVEYDLPESVQHTGSTRGQVVIGEQGGEVESGPALNAIGLVGVQQRLDLLAKTYIAQGIINTGSSSTGLAGGSVQLYEDGTQQMFVAGEGFEAKFAEVVLNDARDAALLTIINANNEVQSAQLDLDQFIVTGDGKGVRFFGTMDDFDFSDDSDEVLREEFEDYRNAIDKVIGAGV